MNSGESRQVAVIETIAFLLGICNVEDALTTYELLDEREFPYVPS